MPSKMNPTITSKHGSFITHSVGIRVTMPPKPGKNPHLPVKSDVNKTAAKAKVWMPKEPELNNDGGFLRLRHGLKEHIRKGYITSNDFAAYYTLHCFADWTTGICETTAASLAAMWGDWECKDKKRAFRTALERLRERAYIDYPLGGGEHGVYPVLINRAEPTKGLLKGWRLRLRAGKPGSSDFSNPWYEYVSPTSFYDAYGEQADR